MKPVIWQGIKFQFLASAVCSTLEVNNQATWQTLTPVSPIVINNDCSFVSSQAFKILNLIPSKMLEWRHRLHVATPAAFDISWPPGRELQDYVYSRSKGICEFLTPPWLCAMNQLRWGEHTPLMAMPGVWYVGDSGGACSVYSGVSWR